MASLRADVFGLLIRKTMNVNPIKCKNVVERFKLLSKLFINNKVPKGFVLSKEKSQNGAKYERISKEGANKTGRVILYLHGGAYISGLVWVYRNFANDYYKASGGCELIMLDYSCAPEHKYPTQLNEAMDLWEELTEKQGYDPQNIIIGGDSAGGNLTLALLLKLRDMNKPMPKAAFCISAWTDMTGSGKSYRTNYGHDILFGEKGKKPERGMAKKLLESDLFSFVGDADRRDPYVSPVFGEYHDFPPMFFTVGGHEMLLDDTLRIVKKLKKNKVKVGLDVQPEMFHIYTLSKGIIPEGTNSYNKILEFIQEQFFEKEQFNKKVSKSKV